MAVARTTRFFLLILLEIARKYTRALIAGLILGVVGSIGFLRIYPNLTAIWLHPVKRIGIIGQFTPTNLPLFIQRHISRGLTSVGSDGIPKSDLALSWEATNSGKTYIFTLDSNTFWHTNAPVLASDVNYNIRNVTFSALSKDKLQATLDAPYSPFLTLVSKPIIGRGLNGFGIYKVDRVKLNGPNVQFMRLVAAHDTKLPTFEYRFYKTEAQAITAFAMGDVSEIDEFTDTSSFLHWNTVSINAQIKENRIVALYFNLKNQRLSDKSFRQGLAYAVPELPYARVYSPINDNSWAYTDTIRRYDYDSARAKKLFSQIPSATSSAELTITTFSQYLDTANSIAESWTALGIPTQVKVENEVPADYQVLLSAQDIPPDPDQYPFWHSTQTQTNITGYVNVKIDKLLEDGRQEQSQEKRKKIYADFAHRLTEDVPAVFLYHPKTYSVIRRP